MRLLHPSAGDHESKITGDALRDLYDAAGYVRGGMVASVDGAIAVDGVSKGLQTPGDLDVFRALRASADVVLVGAGTARAESYGPVTLGEDALTWRAGHGRAPTVPLAVVSAHLSLDPAAALFPTGPDAARTIVVTCAAAPAGSVAALADVADVVVVGDETVDLPAAVAALAARGLARVLCEGGPGLLGDLARAGELTELCATVSPLLAGSGTSMLAGKLSPPLRLELVHLLYDGAGLLGRWRVG